MEGPHLLPGGEQVRVALPGVSLEGQRSTLLVIYCPVRRAWVFYLDCDPRRAVVVGRDETGPLGVVLPKTGGR